MLLQVHDELVIEAPADEAERAAAVVKRHMEGAAKLDGAARGDDRDRRQLGGRKEVRNK